VPRFAANLSFLYPDRAFLERFEAASRDGFRGVEFLYPYDHAPGELRSRMTGHGLELALFNGLASLPGREDEFRRSIEQALAYARVLGNRCLHVLAGILPPEADRARHRATYIENVAWAADLARPENVTVTLEPINPRDIPGYFLNRQDEAHAICREADRANLAVQMDFYHCQIVEGDLATTLREYVRDIAHIQVAGVPGRHEPDVGEVNYPYLFALIDELGYEGWIGCEYHPLAGTSAGLGWARPWLGAEG